MSNATVTFEAYSNSEVIGVSFLVAAGALSLVTAGSLFLVILIKICTTKDSNDVSFFRTPLAAYLACLLFGDMIEAVSSIINVSWVIHRGIEQTGLCTAQAALKQGGHVATALWSLTIACHTFLLLFYRKQCRRWVMYATLIGVWLLVILIMLIGPLAIATPHRGSFWGIKGSWCWIEDGYTLERHLLQYDYQFISAFGSLTLYTLVFLRLRGNITVNGWRFVFKRRSPCQQTPALQPDYYTLHQRRDSNSPLLSDPSQPSQQVLKAARHMMLYPIAYSILLLPHATTRFMYFNHHNVSDVTMICTSALLMLNGFVDTVLFFTTRRVIPARVLLPRRLRSFFGLSTSDRGNESNARYVSSSRRQMAMFHGGKHAGVVINVERVSDGNMPQSPTPAHVPRGSLHLHHQHRPLGPYDMITMGDGCGVSPSQTRSSIESTRSGRGADMLTNRKIVWPNQHRPNTSTGTGEIAISGSTVVRDEDEPCKEYVNAPRSTRPNPPAVVEFDASRPQAAEAFMTPTILPPGLNRDSVGYQYRVHDHPYASPQAMNQPRGRYA